MTTALRPVRNKAVFLTAYKKWCNGKPQTEIVKESGVTSRTVERWVSQFKKLPQEETMKDMKFQPIFIHQYGMSWRDVDSVMDNLERFAEKQDEYPTGRQAVWFWRLSQCRRLYRKVENTHKLNEFTETLSFLMQRLEAFEIENLLNQPTTESEEELSNAVRAFQQGNTPLTLQVRFAPR